VATGGTPQDPDALAWYTPEQRERARESRARALDILRRLYLAWLTATIRLEDGEIKKGLTRAEVIALIRDAQKDLRQARQRLRQSVEIPPQPKQNSEKAG
jgi:hypothetical protein